VEAASGAAALATVAAQPIQAMPLDLRLPDIDGVAVCRRLRGSGAETLPVILVSADHTPQLERRATAAGVTSVLRKPFEPEDSLERLAAVGVSGADDEGGTTGGSHPATADLPRLHAH
jgi:two-component system response regulator MprA